MEKYEQSADISPAISTAECLAEIQKKRTELDMRIQALNLQGGADLVIAALKREKLKLEDEMARLKDSSVPDIIA